MEWLSKKWSNSLTWNAAEGYYIDIVNTINRAIIVLISQRRKNMYRKLLTIVCLLCVARAGAQDKEKLFGTKETKQPKHGLLIKLMGDGDLPAADMAKRFGTSFRIGPAIEYKTKSNWLFGVKADFIFGNVIREDSLMINIKDQYGNNGNKNVYEFINGNGQRIGVPVYERGYMIGLEAGRIFSFSEGHPDDGLTTISTVGFMQHKINIFNSDKDVPELQGSYLKGYDRLTNGIFVEEFLGYTHIDRKQLLNYTIGFDGAFGFTQGRRDYLYDVMRPDNKKRLDILYGIRAGWFFPIMKKKSEDLSFE
jgi:hypothetical protein